VSGQFAFLLKNYTNDSGRREKETLLKIVAKKGVDVRVNESFTEIKKFGRARSLHIFIHHPAEAAVRVIVALFLLPSEVAKVTFSEIMVLNKGNGRV